MIAGAITLEGTELAQTIAIHDERFSTGQVRLMIQCL